MIEFGYNSQLHSSIQMSPFELAYGCNPLSSKDISALTIDANKLGFAGEEYAGMMRQTMVNVQDDIVQAQ